jgi:hypothetical protein
MKMSINGVNKQYIWMQRWLLWFAQSNESGCAREIEGKRESVLFIGTQFSILYTSYVVHIYTQSDSAPEESWQLIIPFLALCDI